MTDAAKARHELLATIGHTIGCECGLCEGVARDVDILVAAVRAETLRETQTAPCDCPCRGECK
jgi:hypothetical protein